MTLPTLAAFAWFVIGWRPWRRLPTGSAGPDGRWAGGLALASALCLTQAGFVGWPALPPTESWQWAAWLALLAAAWGVLDGVVRLPRLAGIAGAVALAVVAAWLSVPEFYPHVRLGQGLVVGFAAALCLTIDVIGRRRPGAAIPAALLVVAGAAAVVIVASSNAKMSQLVGAVAAGLGAAVVAAWWKPRLSLAGGAATVFGTVLPVLLFNAHASDYGDVPPAAFLLVAGAPLALWLAELPVVQRLRPWQAAVVRVVLVSVPIGIALAMAVPRLTADGGYS